MICIDQTETKTFVSQNIFLQMMRNDLKMCQSEKNISLALWQQNCAKKWETPQFQAVRDSNVSGFPCIDPSDAQTSFMHESVLQMMRKCFNWRFLENNMKLVL